MKIYDKQDIDNSFSKAIDAMQRNDVKAQDLSIFFGSLSISIASRIHQLNSGVAKATNKNTEISKLQEAENCLKAKINTGTVSEMSQQIMEAYKAYGTSN